MSGEWTDYEMSAIVATERAEIAALAREWAQQCTDDPRALTPSVILRMLADEIEERGAPE